MRWVHVRDLDGTHRDEYLFCTDPNLSPEEIVSIYTGRWNIETTFQEVKTYFRPETLRCRLARSVFRATPLLFGLYSIVFLIYGRLRSTKQGAEPVISWQGKKTICFSEMLSVVRTHIWEHCIFPNNPLAPHLHKLPSSFLRPTLTVLSIAT